MDDLLFPPDVDLGRHRIVNGGCAEPIGKQGRSRRRIRRAAPRLTTLNALVDIRRLLADDLPLLRHGQTQLRQGQQAQVSALSDTNDLLQQLLARIHKLERAAGIVEQPQAPRPSRNKLFD